MPTHDIHKKRRTPASVKRWSALLIIAFLIAAASLQSCLVATERMVIIPPIGTLFEGDYTVDPYIESHIPRVVAVIPFVDLSRSKEGFEKVRRGFYNHFSSLPYTDIEIYRVDELLRKAGLTDPAVIRDTPPQELGKILKADAVVFGTISNFDKLFAVLYSQVAVGAKIEMYDTREGHFLWSGEHVSRIHEGGIATTPVGLIATIIATSLNVRDIQLLRACDDLFRDMVKTIPVPDIRDMSHPPAIALLTQDTKNAPKRGGDIIQVVLQGAPGMNAYFDIGDFRKGVEMKEVEPGGYLGSYRVEPGDNVKGAIVTGYLSDSAGNTSLWIDAIGSVTIDTTPPTVPERMKSAGRNGIVTLSWNGNKEDDLAGYTIYRSTTPLSGFVKITGTEFTTFGDEGLLNNQRYFYRVTAYDFAGNESDMSATCEGIPVAPGPTPVTGTVENDTTWYAGSSPYVIEGAVIVRDKALLSIEPGTVIISRGEPIIVEGRINAAGDEAHMIRFEAEKGMQWAGIIFQNVKEKENFLAQCRISDAQTGIICRSSSPVIDNCELTDNGVGIIISDSFSRPVIRNCVIRKNGDAGMVIENSARPLVSANIVRDNGKGGVIIRNAEPLLQANSILQNRGPGIDVENSIATITNNNIYDNLPVNMKADYEGQTVNARDNWWGTAEGREILLCIAGRIDITSVLDGPYPEGNTKKLSIIRREMPAAINADSYCIVSESPYTIAKEVVIDGGATLYIEPGVTLLFDQNTSIELKNGGIIAKGTRERPIVFSASAASPTPGFYMNAVRFTGSGQTTNSFFEYCSVRYAVTAFDIFHGTPDISYCYVADTAQGGIYCRNDAAPTISFTTFRNNRGMGAIQCVGMSKPFIAHNNFEGNTLAIQAFSTICIDARNNWWGEAPPDRSLILEGGEESITITPWLVERAHNAFDMNLTE
ncbi:MAG: DUF799 family lipoprotein [Deltaproteobacteria bacterium]|nr:DUF799 family lipoprotein [Deltaproteobacteria bacterium]